MDYDTYIKEPLPFIEELKRYYKRNDKLTIFEIGSCEGEDTIRLKKAFPKSTVYTFEPLSENIKKIRNNFERYDIDDNHTYQIALSDKDGTSEFYVSSGHPDNVPRGANWDYGNKSSSLLAPKEAKKTHKWLRFNKKIKVNTLRLDTFCSANSINRIDFIWLDVQGAELKVLRGLGELIKNVNAIWMEVESIELYKGQPLKNEVEEFMSEHNFKCIADTVDNISGDQLYINNGLVNNRSAGFLSFFKGADPEKKDKAQNDFSKISYSQSGEDLIIKFILDQLKIERPIYVDIGAHHPRYINNTAIFYDNGSTGINIEPDPGLFKVIAKDRKKDINLNIGVGSKKDVLDFYVMSTPTLNTFSKDEVKTYEKEGYSVSKKIKVEVDKLDSIFDKYLEKAPDFINLDAEGVDYEILKNFNFDKYGPLVWCIETISFSQTGHGVKDRKMIDLLESRGYLYYADTYINSIFVNKDAWVR